MALQGLAVMITAWVVCGARFSMPSSRSRDPLHHRQSYNFVGWYRDMAHKYLRATCIHYVAAQRVTRTRYHIDTRNPRLFSYSAHPRTPSKHDLRAEIPRDLFAACTRFFCDARNDTAD